MATTEINELPNAAALTGAEYIPADQGGTTVRITVDQIGNFTLYGMGALYNLNAPNNVVPVMGFFADPAETNADFAVVPKGTGALFVAVPDNTAVGGNKRGPYSVDLQLSRAAASQVASGDHAFLVSGESNTASGASSGVLAGSENIASGDVALVYAGEECSADGLYSASSGSGSTARTLRGAHSYSGAYFDNPGDAQGRRATLACATTDATPAVLTADLATAASTNVFVLPNNSTYSFKAQVLVREGATGDSKSWDVAFLISRGANAASTALIGSPSFTIIGASAGAATWDLNVSANTTLGAAAFTGTGEAAHNLHWIAVVNTAELVSS